MTKVTPRPLGGTYGAGDALRARQKKLARRRGKPKTGALKRNDHKCEHGIKAGEFCVQCPKTCCLCKEVYTGWGNNAWPLDDEGRCCSDCNAIKVVPARLAQAFAARNAKA